MLANPLSCPLASGQCMKFDYLKRREFITLLGGAAAAWPLAARAQQPAMPVIGYLSTRSSEDTTHLAAAFRAGLAQSGYVEGQNVSIEYRWALGQYNRLPELAAELVQRPVTVLATTGGEPAAFAATGATSTIPIIYLIGGDPVKEGLAASFNRPGGNATGVTLLTNLLEPKRFSVLRDLMPGVSLIGVLLNPKFPAAEPALRRRPIQTRALDLWRDDDTVEVIGSPIELKRGAYVKSKVRCRLLQDFGGRNGYPRAIDLHLVVAIDLSP